MRHILSAYRADHNINVVGVNTTSIGSIQLDSEYLLVHLAPTYSIAVAYKKGEPVPSLQIIVFYANCISYECELPTEVAERGSKNLNRPIERGNSKYFTDAYHRSLLAAYESVVELRYGPLATISFPDAYYKESDLFFSTKYKKVSMQLALYGMGLRQVDPLSEFLCYYRVIESITGDNGKKWIGDNWNKLESYNFGFLRYMDSEDQYWHKRRNLFSLFRQRALKRIKKILDSGSTSIEKYLYNENRCGIAHSNHGVKIFDFAETVSDLYDDVYVVKLLARMAIDLHM